MTYVATEEATSTTAATMDSIEVEETRPTTGLEATSHGPIFARTVTCGKIAAATTAKIVDAYASETIATTNTTSTGMVGRSSSWRTVAIFSTCHPMTRLHAALVVDGPSLDATLGIAMRLVII